MNNLTNKEKKAYEAWLDHCREISVSTAPIKNESPREKKERIERLLDPANFYEFCTYYFPDFVSAPFAWFHKEAIDDVLVKRERNNIWEWHRESAKSVFGDVFIVTHLLVSGWLTGMILGSENEYKAKNLIKDVQAHLMSNKRLINDFGDFGITGSWLQGYFKTKQGIGFWAFGLGQNPAGVRDGHRRPNLGIIDDADSYAAAKNQKRTKERISWIKGEFMGCLSIKEHIFIYSNNRVHKEGLTAHMVGDLDENTPKNKGYKHIKVFLTEDPVTHERLLPEQGGVPAWRENFTIEMCLDKIEDMGYRDAMRQMYHWHIEEGNVFTDENMPWVQVHELHQYEALVSYCDPAFGESGKGCYRGIVLMGKRGLRYDIIWVWLKQNGNFAAAQRRLAALVEENSPVLKTPTYGFRQKINCTHWTESNDLQKVLLKKIYQEENLLHDEPWWPRFDMDKKADKIGRIESLETVADHGHLGFNQALQSDKDMITLRDQFKGFPDGFIDGPDCVHGGYTKLSKKNQAKSKARTRAGKYKRNMKRLG